MAHLLNRCPSCHAYTLAATCPKCKSATVNPHPPKFSPVDPYARFRRQEKYGSQGIRT